MDILQKVQKEADAFASDLVINHDFTDDPGILDTPEDLACYIGESIKWCQEIADWTADLLESGELGTVIRARMNSTIALLQPGRPTREPYDRLLELLIRAYEILVESGAPDPLQKIRPEEFSSRLSLKFEEERLSGDRDRCCRPEWFSSYLSLEGQKGRLSREMSDPIHLWRQHLFYHFEGPRIPKDALEAALDRTVHSSFLWAPDCSRFSPKVDPFALHLLSELPTERACLKAFATALPDNVDFPGDAALVPLLCFNPVSGPETVWQQHFTALHDGLLSRASAKAARWTWLGINLLALGEPPYYGAFDVDRRQQEALRTKASELFTAPRQWNFYYLIREVLELIAKDPGLGDIEDVMRPKSPSTEHNGKTQQPKNGSDSREASACRQKRSPDAQPTVPPKHHCDIPLATCADAREAARWAWKCLEELAAVFCRDHCVPSCTMARKPPQGEAGRDDEWQKVQQNLHEALAYIPELSALTGCRACAIVESFKCFPRLAELSSVPPVAMVLMEDAAGNGEAVYVGGRQRPSLPCVVVKTDLGDDRMRTENKVREQALLEADLSKLPPMPPKELESLKARFLPGQTIVRRLSFLCRSSPTEEEASSDRLRQILPYAIVGALALRDLISALVLYPKAMNDETAQQLHKELLEVLKQALANEELSAFSDYAVEFGYPQLGDPVSAANAVLLSGLLALMHPDIDTGDGSQEKITEGIGRIYERCHREVEGQLKEARDHVIRMRMFDCDIPAPKNDPTFQEPARFAQMLGEYWRLCRKVIVYEMNARVYAPEAIAKVMTILRNRMTVCIARLSKVQGSQGAQEAVDGLVATAITRDFDVMAMVPESFEAKIDLVDEFLRVAELALGNKTYPLTPEEDLFLKQAGKELDGLHACITKKWNEKLRSVEPAPQDAPPASPSEPPRVQEEDKAPMNAKETTRLNDPELARRFWPDWSLGWFEDHTGNKDQLKLHYPASEEKKTASLKKHLSSHQYAVLKNLYDKLASPHASLFSRQELAQLPQLIEKRPVL